jgi:hypothetical protein
MLDKEMLMKVAPLAGAFALGWFLTKKGIGPFGGGGFI